MTLAVLGIIILVRMKDSHLPRRHLHTCLNLSLKVASLGSRGLVSEMLRRQQSRGSCFVPPGCLRSLGQWSVESQRARYFCTLVNFRCSDLTPTKNHPAQNLRPFPMAARLRERPCFRGLKVDGGSP